MVLNGKTRGFLMILVGFCRFSLFFEHFWSILIPGGFVRPRKNSRHTNSARRIETGRLEALEIPQIPRKIDFELVFSAGPGPDRAGPGPVFFPPFSFLCSFQKPISSKNRNRRFHENRGKILSRTAAKRRSGDPCRPHSRTISIFHEKQLPK